MKRSGISTLCGAIVLCTISTAAMAAADSRRGVGHAASGPMFDLPAGMNVSQQETHISLYAVRLLYVFKIGRAHVCTPVTNAHLVCRLLLENKQRTPLTYINKQPTATSH